MIHQNFQSLTKLFFGEVFSKLCLKVKYINLVCGFSIIMHNYVENKTKFKKLSLDIMIGKFIKHKNILYFIKTNILLRLNNTIGILYKIKYIFFYCFYVLN